MQNNNQSTRRKEIVQVNELFQSLFGEEIAKAISNLEMCVCEECEIQIRELISQYSDIEKLPLPKHRKSFYVNGFEISGKSFSIRLQSLKFEVASFKRTLLSTLPAIIRIVSIILMIYLNNLG